MPGLNVVSLFHHSRAARPGTITRRESRYTVLWGYVDDLDLYEVWCVKLSELSPTTDARKLASMYNDRGVHHVRGITVKDGILLVRIA